MVDVSAATDRLVAGGALAPGIIAPPTLYNPAPIWGQIAAKMPGATPTPISAPLPSPSTTTAATPSAAPATPSAVTAILAQHDPSFDAFWTAMLPGESGGKDVPNYRYDLGHTASGLAQITDTNWKSWAPRLGIDVTRFPTAMSAPPEWQKAVAKLMHRALGSAPWDAAHGGSLPVAGGEPGQSGEGKFGLSPESSKLYGEANSEMEKAAADFKKRIEGLTAGDAEFDKVVKETQARIDKASDALMAAVSKAPVPPKPDIGRLGSMATIIGMIGGLFTRQPMLGALNGAAGALEGANQNDWAQYNAGLKTWKTQSDMLLQITEMQQRRLQDIMADRHMEMSDRLALANSFLRANEMEPQLKLSEAGQIDKMLELSMQVQANAAKMRAENARLPLIEAQTKQAEAKAEQTEQQNKMMAPAPAGPLPDKWEGKPDTPPPGSGIDPGVWASAVAYVKSGGTIHPPFSLWGNNPLALSFNHAIPLVEKALGIRPSELATVGATYQGERSAQRALGTRLSALSVGINEASAAAPAVIQTSKSVPRTDFSPILNAAITNGKFQSGDPNIVRFKAALQTFLNRYAAAINPQGHMTDQQQRHAYDVLSTAMTHGQLEAGVNQLLAELNYMRSGLQDAIGTVGGAYAGGVQPQLPGGQSATPNAPPPGAVEELKGDPSPQRREQFDEIFGDGAAARVLGQ